MPGSAMLSMERSFCLTPVSEMHGPWSMRMEGPRSHHPREGQTRLFAREFRAGAWLTWQAGGQSLSQHWRGELSLWAISRVCL